MLPRGALTRIGSMVLWVTVWLLTPAPVSGQEPPVDEVFTVRNVAVDVTASAAALAREQALAEGEVEALQRLMRRITRRSDWHRLPEVDAPTARFLVQDFEVAGERTSSVRYLANVTYRFKPAEIRRLLRRAGVPFAETVSKPVLVLPILTRAGALVLWDDPNPWRDAWARQPERDDGMVPLVVPLGDLADIADVSAERAAAGDQDRLTSIARRYGADDSLVAIATVVRRPSGIPSRLEVAASRVGATTQQPVVLEFEAATDEALDSVFDRAAAATADAIEDAWKEANLLRFDEERRMRVAVQFGGLSDWIAIRSRLAKVAVISAANLRSLTREAAEMELIYIGDEDQLADALAQSDLLLEVAPPPPPSLTGAPVPAPVSVLRLAAAAR
ncbi:MAG: DUF2066 domain-containing protein [Alphaproteobacteria bacterium]